MLEYYDKKTYRYKKISWMFILAAAILIFLLGNLSGQKTIKRKIVIEKTEILPVIDTNDYTTFNEKNLKHLIKVLNIQHPDIVYAQAVLESGHFKSELFLRNNNLFGMGVPSSRRMLTSPTEGKFSNYKANHIEGWQLSVIDYALWQDTYAYYLSREEYLDYLSSAYAEDPKYVDKIINLIK